MPKSRGRKKNPKAAAPQKGLSDREINRLMNQLLADMGEKNFTKLAESLGDLGDLDKTPEEIAQEILWKAEESEDPDERIDLACQALTISHRCSDALLLLANEMDLPQPAYFALVLCAERGAEEALGDAAFEEDEGHFWGIVETRPYMRALATLADALWQMGQREQAIMNMRKMLRLNPNDNQGIRYRLLHVLVMTGEHDEAQGLIAQYPDDGGAYWDFGKSLAAFAAGRKPEAETIIRQAIAANPHVLPYLKKPSTLPVEKPHFYSPGKQDEAILYTHDMQDAWAETKEAMKWLGGL